MGKSLPSLKLFSSKGTSTMAFPMVSSLCLLSNYSQITLWLQGNPSHQAANDPNLTLPLSWPMSRMSIGPWLEECIREPLSLSLPATPLLFLQLLFCSLLTFLPAKCSCFTVLSFVLCGLSLGMFLSSSWL